MMRRDLIIACTAALAIAQGCATTGGSLPLETTAPAPTQLGFSGEVGALGGPGYAASAALSYEATGCCGLGTYFHYSKLIGKGDLEVFDDRDDTRNGEHETDIIEGGAELAAVLPWWSDQWLTDRFRLRLRAGMAGTAPERESAGRRGLGGSAALLLRLSDPSSPEVGGYASQLDLLIGGQIWALGPTRTSAGLDETSSSGVAFYIGVRAGAGIGVDLR